MKVKKYLKDVTRERERPNEKERNEMKNQARWKRQRMWRKRNSDEKQKKKDREIKNGIINYKIKLVSSGNLNAIAKEMDRKYWIYKYWIFMDFFDEVGL